MNRRDFIGTTASAVAVAVASGAQPAAALLSCNIPFQGWQQCAAGIDSGIANVTAAAVGGQHLNQWCWAACIEMVFRYYGYHVPQEEIVQQTWGRIVNLPAQPAQILANLNRSWQDSSGAEFSVSGTSYGANPVTAAQDLSQNMPLVIGTMGHAMVLTSLTYARNQFGQGKVQAATVRDPWPNRGRRTLTAAEWYNTSFLARIRVFQS